MNVVGIIPARYNSSRLPGKPLADICGNPMIWWVYKQAIQVKELDALYVATDDRRIESYCVQNEIPVRMTSINCPNHIQRIWEVSNIIESNYYISINGDEPLIKPDNIRSVFPERTITEEPYFASVYRELKDPAETLDLANVKIVLDSDGYCLYQSRTPIPYPKSSLDFLYKKAIGIECFNKKALDFFVNTPMGILEKIEDIDHLRFLENGIPIHYTKIDSESLSVDTNSDLEKVRSIIRDM